jgi:uncharacterized iron-regulated membrane protein
MAFYQPTAAFMSRLLDDHPPVEAAARVMPRAVAPRPWPSILSSLDRTFADGDAVFYYPGTEQNARLLFRKRLPGEWHPNGRSYISIDPYTAEVVEAIDARAQGLGTRMMNTVYPIHAAKVGGATLTAFAALAATALTWLAIGGTWTYARRAIFVKRPSAVSAVRSARNDLADGAARYTSGITRARR